MPIYKYQIEGGLNHMWKVDNVIETADSNNELIFNDKQKQKQKCILEMMRLLLKETKRRGIKIFAISGTLLGAKRNKGIIPYDDDGDFGFTMTEYIKLQDLAKTFSHPNYIFKEAIETGFRMVNRGDYISHIDLFAMGIDSDPNVIVHISPIIDNKPTFYIQHLFPKEWMDADCIETLEWCEFEDFKVPCPINAEKQLAHIYNPTCLTTYVPDTRNISGVDLHTILMYFESIGSKLFEAGARFNKYYIPDVLKPNDRRGYINLTLARIVSEILKVDLDQSDVARKRRIQTIIDDYLKYKGVLL